MRQAAAMRFALAVCAAAAAVTACKRDTRGFCNQTADCEADEFCDVVNRNCVSTDQPDAAFGPCDTNQQCFGSRPYCDVPTHTCVECGAGETSRCTDTAPVCASDHTCQPCTADALCPSMACLPSGACADEATVIYAAVGGGDNNCDRLLPCNANRTVAVLTTTRNIIRFSPERHDVGTLQVGMNATMIGRGSELRYVMSVGPVINVAAGRELRIHYLTLSNADDPAGAGDGITCLSGSRVIASEVTIRNNDDVGIDGIGCVIEVDRSTIMLNKIGVRSDATVTVTGSSIREQTQAGLQVTGGGARLNVSGSILYLNQGGGLQALIGASYGVENNILVVNGGAGSGFGGANFDSSAANRFFRFNTVANNTASVGVPAGLRCGILGATASSNIFINNTTEAGNCTVTYSLFNSAPPPGAGNVMGDPMFLNTTPDLPFAADFYRIGATSAAKDVGEAIDAVVVDIDDEARPEGAGRDIGADERHP